MNNQLVEWSDKQLLRKRAVIESVIGQLKHICQIEHSRRSRSAVLRDRRLIL